MNQSFDNKTSKQLRQSKSLKYCSLMEEGSTKTIDDIKSKIDKFKRIKQQSQPEEILDFDVSREALKKYQPGHISKTLTHDTSSTSIGKSKPKPSLMQHQQQQSAGETSLFNINIKNIFKSTSNNAKERPSAASSIQTPSASGTREYIQWKQNSKEINNTISIGKKISNDNKLNLNQPQLDDQNRIKTQINLFVKQLNYTSTPSNTNGLLKETTHSYNNSNITHNNSKIILNSQNNNNLIINGLDSFQLSDSTRGKKYQKVIKSNSGPLSMIKLDEVKSIKSTLYIMTNEDLSKLPQDYIDELKDLACLINTVF